MNETSVLMLRRTPYSVNYNVLFDIHHKIELSGAGSFFFFVCLAASSTSDSHPVYKVNSVPKLS